MIAGFLRGFGLVLLKVPVAALGFLVVWLALPFAKPVAEKDRPFSQYPQRGSWRLVRLPWWARLWDNAFDGMLGDKRGWWANYCLETYGRPHTDLVCMWRWAALRNPANYFSRNVCGVDVSGLRIVEIARRSDPEVAPYRGWYLLKGMAENGGVYPRLFLQWAIVGPKGLMIDIGWKIKMSHNGTSRDAEEKDRIKGLVFVVSLAKDLE